MFSPAVTHVGAVVESVKQTGNAYGVKIQLRILACDGKNQKQN